MVMFVVCPTVINSCLGYRMSLINTPFLLGPKSIERSMEKLEQTMSLMTENPAFRAWPRIGDKTGPGVELALPVSGRAALLVCIVTQVRNRRWLCAER